MEKKGKVYKTTCVWCGSEFGYELPEGLRLNYHYSYQAKPLFCSEHCESQFKQYQAKMKEKLTEFEKQEPKNFKKIRMCPICGFKPTYYYSDSCPKCRKEGTYVKLVEKHIEISKPKLDIEV